MDLSNATDLLMADNITSKGYQQTESHKIWSYGYGISNHMDNHLNMKPDGHTIFDCKYNGEKMVRKIFEKNE